MSVLKKGGRRSRHRTYDPTPTVAVDPYIRGQTKSSEHGPAFELGGKERRVPCRAADQHETWPGWNKPTLGRWFRRAMAGRHNLNAGADGVS